MKAAPNRTPRRVLQGTHGWLIRSGHLKGGAWLAGGAFSL
jgi:hypothetical protein